MSKQANGYVIYEGPSALDGEPIVVIMTMHSANVKTGDMVQTWILRSDVSPMAALDSKADASVCGDCKHRRSMGGACYVDVSRAPLGVWKAYKRGAYPVVSREQAARLCMDRMVRLGAYGDPAAAPAGLWRVLVAYAKGHTGYTHQWRLVEAAKGTLYDMPHSRDALKGLLMASVDTQEEAEEARKAGWRYFRVRLEGETKMDKESTCPASAEAGNKVQCHQCGLCNGAGTGRKGSIAIDAHGSLKGRFIRIRNASVAA